MGIPFNEKELEVVEVLPPNRGPEFEVFSYPVTDREAYKRTFAGKPVWILTGKEVQTFLPRVVPDYVARGFVVESAPFNPLEEAGGPDMFGIQWVYVPTAGGSMEDPNIPAILEDVNDWKEVIQFPDVDSWKWEEAAERNKGFLDDSKAVQTWIFTGWFERLISFMGFENAAMALLDEDQRDALIELMDALSDTYIDIIDHYVKYFDHIDSFYIHDDWGSQQAPFFNPEVAREVIVPAMKKVTNHLHELGIIAEFHSCGNHGAQQIDNIVAAGWDVWAPQKMNDIDALWQAWGNRIVLSPPIVQDAKALTEEELIAEADAHVATYCSTPGKPVVVNFNDQENLLPAFRRELYIQSRQAYANWP